MNEYRIEAVTRKNISKLPDLMKHCFNMEVSEEYFIWKYFENPAGPIMAFYAIHNKTQEIAGFYVAVPLEYFINQTRKVIYRTGDSMTHNSHRRKGIWKMLINHCHDELSKQSNLITFSTSSGQAMSAGRQKKGWRPLFNMVNYFLPKVMSPLFKKKYKNNIEIINDYNVINHLFNKRHSDIQIVKTPGIYKWRTSNPRFNYISIGYKINEEFSSYLTYYIDQDKITLFDFHFSNKKESKQLVSYLLVELRKYKLKGIISLVQEKSHYAKQLKKAGFIYNPFSFGPLSYKWPFLFYAEKENIDKFINPELWSISSFDHDAT